MRKLFGTDGIRGVANKPPLTIDLCWKLAAAVVTGFCKSKSNENLILIGKDTRISGDMFEHALAACLCSLGVKVKLLGVVPTPAVSMLTSKLRANAGIMVSASHNPFQDNGIKLFRSNGLKLTDEEESKLEKTMADDGAHRRSATGTNIGRIFYVSSELDLYRARIKNSFNFSTAKIKIVLDSANGSFTSIAPDILRGFGFDVVSLNDVPNGVNINENCGVISPHILSENVVRHQADIGIALDGDGDRVLLADENGQILDGDHILAILTQSEETSEVVSTIMSNFGLEKYLSSQKIRLIKTNVGDRYISKYMQNSDAKFGAEPSGHIIIKSHLLTGDGLFAGLKVIEYMLKSGKKCSQLRLFSSFPTISKNLQTTDCAILSRPHVKKAIQQFTRQLKGRGKLIVRPSGTEPIIRILAEGENPPELHNIVDALSKIIGNKA
ncbi:MAG: phosphoglucosamine mutase [Holosporaceae bacterium]|nr:phosphoglucosamine mutase [Holosporaceae bacterium]